jgi:hypothetical protein
LTNRTTPILWILIAGILAVVTFIGYIVTTFLFAFSGGQYRMVLVVNVGAAAVVDGRDRGYRHHPGWLVHRGSRRMGDFVLPRGRRLT